MNLKNIKLIVTNWFSKPWYPLAVSAYPVVALLSANVGQIQNSAGMRSLLVSILFGGVLYFLVWVFLRQVYKAAFLSAVWLALFFSFGHIYISLDAEYPDSNYTLWLAVGWVVLFILALGWVLRSKSTFVASTSTFNTIALALLIMAVGQIMLEGEPRGVSALGADHAPVQNNLTLPQNPPDVYYIILDSYAREDFLRMVYDYDNSEFINALKDRGFYVGACSQSNYVRTELSLASSLNMIYLPELDDEFKPESTARRTLWNSLKHSAVRHNFESMGYETVNFATGFAWNELEDADHFLTPPPFTSGLTEFEGLFLRTTLARYAQDWGWVDPDAVMGQSFRDRFNNVFDRMDEVANMSGPQFSYIHLISPHPPFVFDAEGNPNYPPDFWNEQREYPYDDYQRGYTGQLTYLNTKVLDAVDTILAESDTPPIIVIQGDHGAWMQPKDRRMWILNAYYLPGYEDRLYPNISPVNTFRLIFNSYFGGSYEMLEDKSYFSPVPDLYKFTEMPNTCSSSQ
ncbi:MAG: hypothetical protein JNM02_04910 [Anaerolineales bacterium]|nr:hypothetical protein [Anaerolineales bacterium]